MNAYILRILYDANEDFYRDVEILTHQTFEHLRQILHKCVDISATELSSFYICSDSWEKEREITLMDMSEEDNCLPTMENSVISDYVENSRQRFVYEYDFLNPVTFFIQLISEKPGDNKVKYPRCAGGEGVMKLHKIESVNAGIDYELIDEFNDLLRGEIMENDGEYYPDSGN